MKKKLLSIIALVFCVAMILTGCASLSGVKDANGKPIYFDKAVHFGGHIAEVGDYIYYGNSYVATTDEGFVYKDASEKAYLARINNANAFTFEEDTLNANIPHTSPNEVEKVKANKLVGYENQDMYALGSYLYFTSANVHKTSDMKNDYSQVSLFRIKFDGSDFKEIATFKNDDKSEITLTTGSDGNYYFVAVVPGEEDYSIYSVKVGDSLGKVTTLAENVTSAVIADENSSIKNVIYTVDADKEYKTTSVKSVDIVSGAEEPLDGGVAGSETKLLGRIGDNVFYSYKKPADKVYSIYTQVINQASTNFSPVNNIYDVDDGEVISNIQSAGEGYIFTTESGALVYQTFDGEEKRLMTSSEFEDLLFVNGDYVYTSTSSKISRVSLIDYSVENVVEDVEMISGKCGYTDDYLFFYAKLGELETAEEPEEGEETEVDETYYMYRADKLGNIQLIGKTGKK